MKHSFDWRDSSVASRQALRDLDAYSWAPRSANTASVSLAKAVIFGLLPVAFAVWMGWL